MKIPALQIVLMLLLTVTMAVAADPIGSVIAIQGKATATGEDGKARALELKSSIFLKDKVVTVEGAKLQIQFDDDTVISQGEKSEMVMDEYVYSPANKDENACSAKLVNGAFRVMTGKITKLNPERFKVRTKMATIGIRGCDLGFTITPQGDDIYIIQLHGEEAITVQTKGGANGLVEGLQDIKWGESQTEKKLIQYLKSGQIISITQGGDVTQRDMTPEDLAHLLVTVTPEDAPGGTTGADTGTGEGGGTGDGTGGEDTGTGAETGDGTDTAGDGTAGTTDGGTDTGTGTETTGDTTGTGTGEGGETTAGADTGTETGTGAAADGGTTDSGVAGGGTETTTTTGTGGETADGGAVGGDTLGGDTLGGDTLGGDTLGGDTTGGDTLGGDTTGGEALGGDTLTGGTLGGDTTSDGGMLGGDTLGSDTTIGGDTLGGDTLTGGTLGGDTYTSSGGGTSIGGMDQIVTSGTQNDTVDTITTDATGDTTLPPEEPPPEEPPPSEPPPTEPPPEQPTSTYTAMGGGIDWDWGIWATGSAYDKVQFSGSSIIGASQFDAISKGSTPYNLSGSGAAAAIITHNGLNELVQGSCGLNVQVGQSRMPTWDGSFGMNNGNGDSLSFTALGSIQNDATLTGNQSSYSMNVHGTTFGRSTLTSESISGNLVGPGTGPSPISGAIVDFSFAHGSSATVRGGGGADLR